MRRAIALAAVLASACASAGSAGPVASALPSPENEPDEPPYALRAAGAGVSIDPMLERVLHDPMWGQLVAPVSLSDEGSLPEAIGLADLVSAAPLPTPEVPLRIQPFERPTLRMVWRRWTLTEVVGSELDPSLEGAIRDVLHPLHHSATEE